MIEVELVGVRVEMPSSAHFVVLREKAVRQRSMTIYIGEPEAQAIALAVEGVEPRRPLTHDLLCNVLETLGVTLVRVVVTELVDRTFFAELHLEGLGETHVESSRPSDALALAARVGCPVFVNESLIDEVGFIDTVADEESDADPDEVVEEFRHFIDTVSPEDFAAE